MKRLLGGLYGKRFSYWHLTGMEGSRRMPDFFSFLSGMDWTCICMLYCPVKLGAAERSGELFRFGACDFGAATGTRGMAHGGNTRFQGLPGGPY